MNLSVFAGRRVLVTGHTGFKGCWLALWLHSLGARVFGASLEPPSQPSLYSITDLRELLERDVRVNVFNPSELIDLFTQTHPEIVFHLAAQSLVRRGYQEPALTWQTNVQGTVNVLEAVRATPSVRVAVIATSDKCYEHSGNRGWPPAPFDETDRLGGHDPYSSSKAAAELAVDSWRRSYFGDGSVSLSTVRAGNVIGGGDWGACRIVPNAIRSLLSDEPICIFTRQGIRPWQHVLDCLSGYLSLAAAQWADPRRFAAAYNIGAPVTASYPVSELADKMIARWGTGSWKLAAVHDMVEADILRLETSKAETDLGWQTRLSADETVEWTVDWYKWHAGGSFDAREACLRQIEEYMQR